MTLPPAAAFARDSGVRADDLVVFGRVKGLKYESLDELFMNTRITARLTITRVVSGRPPSRILTIEYIAHTDYVEDRPFRFHLRRCLACLQRRRGTRLHLPIACGTTASSSRPHRAAVPRRSDIELHCAVHFTRQSKACLFAGM